VNHGEPERQQVADRYARAVSAPCEAESDSPVQKGFAVKLAGYSRQELAGLPRDAVVNAFGCGNPLAFSEVAEGEVVVDLGCGAGIDLLLAAQKVGPSGRAIGVDMTDEMLAKAREVIDDAGAGNAEVRKGLIEDLPVESASVEWVISNCVINLSPEKNRVFAEIGRVLKPGGRMLVSDIVAEDLPGEILDDMGMYCCCVAGAISEDKYRDGLNRAGLVDVEIRERITYDATHLEGLVRIGRESSSRSCCSGGEGAPQRSIRELAAACEGKIWSAKIFARKPT
jgi:SAM-dependent methyltransferase